MRTLARGGFVGLGGSLGVVGLVLVGCGGGAAPAPNAASPENASTAPPADAGANPTAESTAPTTTLALADGGDLQGSKLVETHTTGTTPDAGASDGGKPAHGHDVGRSPSDIRAIIQAHRDEARACYDQGIKDHPGVEGDLVIEWTIDPKGNVTQASLNAAKSQILESTIVSCVEDVIKKIQFAASAGGYETRAFYPFNFHPHHGGAKPAP
jgi:hypothetical protein